MVIKKALLLGIFIFLIGFVSACVIPYDGMIITEDTTFCEGEYYLPNGILIGADNVILDCNGAILKNEKKSIIYHSGGLIILKSDNNIIKNCIILNSSTGINDYGAISGIPYPTGTWCRNNNSLINNTIISNEYKGIRLCGNNNLIKNNFIINNTGQGLWGGGIYTSGNNNLIEGNYAEDNFGRNIEVNGGFKTTWYSNGTVSVKIYGINNTIKNNNISVGRIGISSFHYSKIINNVITNQVDGINLGGFGNSNNHIEDNTFLNNSVGIDIFVSDNNTIIDNEFDSNNIGIMFGYYYSTSNNTITKNNFEDNNNNFLVFNKQTDNIVAELNWWGTTNQFEIENKFNFVAPVYSKIDYIPFLCEPYPTNFISDENGQCIPDEDNDGIPNDEDKCPNTEEEQVVYGCSCKQILELKHGENKKSFCSSGIIKVFTEGIGWAKDLF